MTLGGLTSASIIEFFYPLPIDLKVHSETFLFRSSEWISRIIRFLRIFIKSRLISSGAMFAGTESTSLWFLFMTVFRILVRDFMSDSVFNFCKSLSMFSCSSRFFCKIPPVAAAMALAAPPPPPTLLEPFVKVYPKDFITRSGISSELSTS